MVYTILISIVFIAEMIIAVTVVQNLFRLDKAVLDLDDTITATRSGIKDVSELTRKISEQWVILSQDFVDKTKQEGEDLMLRYLFKSLVGALILSLNFKTVKRIRKSKVTRTLAKGWSLLESMV